MTLRLPVITVELGTAEQAQALLEWGEDRGQKTRPGDLWGMLVHSVEGMRRVSKLGAFARVGTQLEPMVRESAVYVAVWRRHFDFEITLHERNMKKLGYGESYFETLRSRKTDELPDGIREAVRLAWAMAESEPIPQQLFDDVRDAFGEERLIELSVTIGYFLMLSDLATVFSPTD